MELGALAAILAALGGVIKLVLDAMGKQTDKHIAAMREQELRQEKFLGNHMSGNTAALAALVEVVSELVEAVHASDDVE
jgi:uncharacterized protein YpuA (DUF1002 family)